MAQITEGDPVSADHSRRIVVTIRRDGKIVHAYLMQTPESMNGREQSAFFLDRDGPLFTVEVESLIVTDAAEVTP